MKSKKKIILIAAVVIAALILVLLLGRVIENYWYGVYDPEPTYDVTFENFKVNPTEKSEETTPVTESAESQEQETFAATEEEQNKLTLADVEAEYGEEVLLRYPNFAELSVGKIDNTDYYVLFDSDGIVHSITNEKVESGFYDGMCLCDDGYMMDESGNLLRPEFLPDEEEIVSYTKNNETLGAILWTVQKVDLLEGSVTTLTARTSKGKVLAQFDSTQDPLTRVRAFDVSTLYEVLTENQDPILYAGGNTYYIDYERNCDCFYLDVDTGEMHYIDYGGYSYPSVQYDDGKILVAQIKLNGPGTYVHTELMDENWSVLPGWEKVMCRIGRGAPSLKDGLLYFEGSVNDEGYPLGFYDTELNLRVDLSQYNVQNVSFKGNYAIIELENPDGIAFWGVMTLDGTWTFEPRTGEVNSCFSLGDRLFVNVNSDNGVTGYQTFTETGESYGDLWEGIRFQSTYESCDGYLYVQIWDGNSYHIMKADQDGNYSYLD